MSEGLSTSGLSHSEVRLVIAVDEAVLVQLDGGKYGFIIMSGSLRSMLSGIEAVIRAMEAAVSNLFAAAATVLTASSISSAARSPPLVQPCMLCG